MGGVGVYKDGSLVQKKNFHGNSYYIVYMFILPLHHYGNTV